MTALAGAIRDCVLDLKTRQAILEDLRQLRDARSDNLNVDNPILDGPASD